MLISFSDYVSKKSCRQECSSSLSCQHGYVCKSIGCNRMCKRLSLISQIRPINTGSPVWPVDRPIDTGSPVWPVDRPMDTGSPVWPIDQTNRVGPFDPRFATCTTQCQISSDCGVNGRCVRQGCNRVCENRLIDQVLPINPVRPGLPGLGCRDECRRSIECGVGAVCIRQGCRRVCEVSVMGPTYPKGCDSQCNSSNDCPFNQVCIRRGCGNVCTRNTVGIKY
jgi:hypothetical protein